MARRLFLLAAATAAVVVFGAASTGTFALFTAAPKQSTGNAVTVDQLSNHFSVTPGSAVQPGTSTPIASGGVDTLSLAFGTVPSARAFTNVFTVQNVGSSSATASLDASGMSRIDSAVFASSGTSSATLAPGASTTVTVSTSPTYAGSGSGTIKLGLAGQMNWLYRAYTTTVTEAPEAPADVTATAKPAGKIQVAWSASATTSGLSGYDVYRKTSGAYTKQNGSVVTGTSYDDTSTTNGTAYTYKVVAVGSGLQSLDSGTASATADSAAPAAPSSVSLANGGGNGSAFVNSANAGGISVDVGLGAGSKSSDTVTLTVTSSGGAGSVSATHAATQGGGTVTLTSVDVSSLADGTLTLSATSTDAAGNVSSAKTKAVTKDTVAPNAPVANYVDKGGADQITGTAEANAKLTANQTAPSASGPYTANANGAGVYTINVANQKNVAVTYVVTATDAAGNVSAQTTVNFNDVL